MLTISRELAHKLAECIHTCQDCIASCLKEDDVKMMTECIRLDGECAEVCSMTLNMVHKDARFMKEALMLCKKVCMACSEECEKHPFDHCQECNKACLACAEACQKFLDEIK